MTLMTTAASAETMKAVRQGLLCERAAALAWLTLPDGSSRTSGPRPSSQDIRIKQAGGCIDIPDGAWVQVLSRRKNTSIVKFDNHGEINTYITPNIDFTDSFPSSAPEALPHTTSAEGLTHQDPEQDNDATRKAIEDAWKAEKPNL